MAINAAYFIDVNLYVDSYNINYNIQQKAHLIRMEKIIINLLHINTYTMYN